MGCDSRTSDVNLDRSEVSNTMQNYSNAASNNKPAIVDADYVKTHREDRLVDVRTPQEYNEGHIPGAINIVHNTMGITTPSQTAAAYEAAGIGPNTPVILYCRSGARAQRVAALLRQAGYQDVMVYNGSWIDWASNPANPVERG